MRKRYLEVVLAKEHMERLPDSDDIAISAGDVPRVNEVLRDCVGLNLSRSLVQVVVIKVNN